MCATVISPSHSLSVFSSSHSPSAANSDSLSLSLSHTHNAEGMHTFSLTHARTHARTHAPSLHPAQPAGRCTRRLQAWPPVGCGTWRCTASSPRTCTRTTCEWSGTLRFGVCTRSWARMQEKRKKRLYHMGHVLWEVFLQVCGRKERKILDYDYWGMCYGRGCPLGTEVHAGPLSAWW